MNEEIIPKKIVAINQKSPAPLNTSDAGLLISIHFSVLMVTPDLNRNSKKSA